jgi:hypothetical protein
VGRGDENARSTIGCKISETKTEPISLNNMKNILVSIFVSLGLFGPTAFAAPAIPTIPSPYAMVTMEYGAPDGHEVIYGLAWNPSGISYVTVDPQTSVADQQAIVTLIQSQANFVTPGARVILINTVSQQVNNLSNAFTVRTTAPWAVTNNSTLTSIPGLQVNLDTNQNYYFRAVLFTNVGAGGSKVDFGGTASPVSGSVAAQITALGANTIVYANQALSFLSGPAGSNTTGVTQIVIEGYFQVNTGGTFVVQFAQNTSNAAASTILQGSHLDVYVVP